MPETEQPGQAPGGTPPAPQTPPAASDPPAEPDETFDAERAKALISKLRGFEKTAKDQAKELETLKAEKQKREEAELGEVERLKRKNAELEQRTQEREREVRDLRLRGSIERAARELAFADPQDAYDLLTARGALEFDEAGEPTNVNEALRDLSSAKPYLLTSGASTPAQPLRRLPPAAKSAAQPAPADLVAIREAELRKSGRYTRLG
jgi:hypothetical protein